MFAASYAWRNGEYYDYGWFVPAGAALLFYRRWTAGEGRQTVGGGRFLMLAGALLLPAFLVLRILNQTDPSWRLPMTLLALLASVAGHGLIAAARGWRHSVSYLLITVLMLSAIPWPSAVEHAIVRSLTAGVTTSVAEIFQILGKPVEVLGDRLRLHEITVEVTDGCSGVRSFQSFLMATWFFAELQRLRWQQTLLLLGFACLIGLAVNVGRTFSLAHIRFTHGESAFEKAHDAAGLLAFLLSAGLFFVFSGKLSSSAPRRILRTRPSS
jgi:exosortase